MNTLVSPLSTFIACTVISSVDLTYCSISVTIVHPVGISQLSAQPDWLMSIASLLKLLCAIKESKRANTQNLYCILTFVHARTVHIACARTAAGPANNTRPGPAGVTSVFLCGYPARPRGGESSFSHRHPAKPRAGFFGATLARTRARNSGETELPW